MKQVGTLRNQGGIPEEDCTVRHHQRQEWAGRTDLEMRMINSKASCGTKWLERKIAKALLQRNDRCLRG